MASLATRPSPRTRTATSTGDLHRHGLLRRTLQPTRPAPRGRTGAIIAEYRGQPLSSLFLTTNHVIFESVTVANTRAGHAVASQLARALRKARAAAVLAGHAEVEVADAKLASMHVDCGVWEIKGVGTAGALYRWC